MRLGSLCTGYGGLDMAVESLLGTETVWLSELDKNASKVCEARFPGVPNLGDLTVVDWSDVEPVDVLTAGFPCQPFSHAGKRQGTNDDRHLWPYIVDALRVLRPSYLVAENVAGLLTLGFDRVLGDLASIGFDAEWCVVRASDVGACHQRKRLFILAADTDQPRLEGAEPAGRHIMRPGGSRHAADTEAERRGTGWRPRAMEGIEVDGGSPIEPRGRGDALPTDPGGERHGRGQDGRVVGRLDGEDAGGPRERERARPLAGDRGHAPAADADRRGLDRSKEQDELPDGPRVEAPRRHDADRLGVAVDWADYAPAIDRHAALVGRAAPAPTDDRGRLSARFVEWMMCLPDGWVTDILPRNPALKALGNGVVPPQAAWAICHLLQRLETREVAA